MHVEFDVKKSLEQLENDNWGDLTYSSYLVRTCHQLRTKPLNAFEVEDLRIMIGQNISLKYLIPIAIKVLDKDLLSEGDMFEGDLLANVLKSRKEYWIENKSEWKKLIDIMDAGKTGLEEFDTIELIRKEWFLSYEIFKAYNLLG